MLNTPLCDAADELIHKLILRMSKQNNVVRVTAYMKPPPSCQCTWRLLLFLYWLLADRLFNLADTYALSAWSIRTLSTKFCYFIERDTVNSLTTRDGHIRIVCIMEVHFPCFFVIFTLCQTVYQSQGDSKYVCKFCSFSSREIQRINWQRTTVILVSFASWRYLFVVFLWSPLFVNLYTHLKDTVNL